MSSIIRTIARSIARLSASSDGKSASKPTAKRTRRKGGRAAADYRSAKRAAQILEARRQRRVARAALKQAPQAVELPRNDGKSRAGECARRIRQIAKAAA